ncbi:hypothetical protein [Glycomyces buryatensis]|nr:hypothetical protein [Glycomyces buryatensis]
MELLAYLLAIAVGIGVLYATVRLAVRHALEEMYGRGERPGPDGP